MKCDICNQEFANSEAVTQHKEEVHPMGDGKDPDLQAPVLIENLGMSDGMEPNERETTDLEERLNR
jgi:hypothetical protein